MSTSDAPNLRRLARQLADYGRRLRHLETVPQLSNSSLDDHGMPVYDADGNLSVTLGKQSDGTYSARPVRGPIPPAPTGLGAEGDAGLVHASWQGVFWAGAAFPRDFEAVEVLVDGNVHGAIHDPDGGSVTVPAFAGEREVSFRTLSQAGRRSDATGHVTVTVQSKASVQLDEARGRIEDAEVSLGETQVRLDEAEQTVASTAEDLTRVETVVIPGAVAELEAADSALWDARDALESDIATVRTSVDGKNAITQSVDAPPTSYDGAVGDRWERMSSMGSGGSLISNWRWNGSVWVSTIISDAVLGNVDAAKIRTGYLDANRIDAQSITAEKLLIGGGGNSIPWSPAKTTEPHEPRYGAALAGEIDPALGAVMRVSGGSRSDGAMLACLVLGTGDTVAGVSGSATYLALEAGRTYALTAGMMASGDLPQGASSVRYEIHYRDGVGAYISRAYGSPVSLVGADAPVSVSMEVDPPPGAAFAVVHVHKDFWSSGDLIIHAPSLRVKSGTTLIEDGAVTTDKLLAGAVTAEKITVTEALSANIVDAMDVNAKKLVVTEEAILNHATLIGDTVVDNINVTGKLIGKDGVFTGTVDFENVNVTGLQLVEKLEANSISADKIEGGAFTGETFEGGTFTGGLFKTSDALPGQVELADDAYVTHLDGGGTYPGLRITPIDTSATSLPAAIGPSANGLTIFGGRSILGGSSIVQCNPTAAFMRTFRDGGGTGSEMQASPDASLLRTYREDGGTGSEMLTAPDAAFMRTYRGGGETAGTIQTSAYESFMRTYAGNSRESGWVLARPQDAELAYVDPNNTYFSRIKADANEAFIYTRAGGASRYLTVDADGVWVKTNRDGTWKQYNLEETAQDSGWHNGTIQPGYSLQGNLVPKARKVGNAIYLSGGVAGDGIRANTSQHVLTLPASFHPTKEWLYTMGSSSSGAASPLWVIKTNGEVLLRTAAVTGNYYMMDGISFLPD